MSSYLHKPIPIVFCMMVSGRGQYVNASGHEGGKVGPTHIKNPLLNITQGLVVTVTFLLINVYPSSKTPATRFITNGRSFFFNRNPQGLLLR